MKNKTKLKIEELRELLLKNPQIGLPFSDLVELIRCKTIKSLKRKLNKFSDGK